MAVLRIEDAHKSFGGTAALRGLSLELRQGETLALLGPNGAGKTTLIRAIAGRVKLDRGRVELGGRDVPPGAPRESLGVVPQEIALYPLLTARENLEVFGRLQGLAGERLHQRVAATLDWIALEGRANEKIGGFSGGMKRRLNIACGVVHEPKVVLLDEPTVGVDPQSRERIWEMLAGLTDRGASLLVTTHMLEEAESRCSRVSVIDHGVGLASGTLDELVEHAGLGGRRVNVRLDGADGATLRALAAVPGVSVSDDGQRVSARIGDVGAELPALLVRLQGAGAKVRDLDVRGADLQAVFLALTGKELRE